MNTTGEVVVVGGGSPYDWEQDDEYRADGLTLRSGQGPARFPLLTPPQQCLAMVIVFLIYYGLVIVVGRT